MKSALIPILALVLLLGCTGTMGDNPGESGAEQNKTPRDNKMPANNTTEIKPPLNLTQLATGGLSMGSGESQVIMIEFSDYQCQFCRRFWEMNFKTLKEEYIDSGKVQFVYKDFPLEFHNAAEDSALAVACAEDHGMGWEMHDKIFGTQANVSSGLVFYAKSDLKHWAQEIRLEQAAFDECIDSGKYSAAVDDSVNEAVSAGFNATPSFVIGLRNRTNYVTLTGALPYGTFRATIEQLLNNS
jgi:protein-disulfide isomerase